MRTVSERMRMGGEYTRVERTEVAEKTD
jgi:hypothetical protein